MLGLSRLAPGLAVAIPGRIWLAGGWAALGLAVELAGLFAFYRARTTITPLNPEKTSALVTGGIYRVTRNPMYVGMACLLTGVAVWLANPLALLPLLAFILYIDRFQIAPEERILAAKFGPAFEDYRIRTRRWL